MTGSRPNSTHARIIPVGGDGLGRMTPVITCKVDAVRVFPGQCHAQTVAIDREQPHLVARVRADAAVLEPGHRASKPIAMTATPQNNPDSPMDDVSSVVGEARVPTRRRAVGVQR